eukprot:11266789-Alexandrium_andersonii.AAC.1
MSASLVGSEMCIRDRSTPLLLSPCQSACCPHQHDSNGRSSLLPLKMLKSHALRSSANGSTHG